MFFAGINLWMPDSSGALRRGAQALALGHERIPRCLQRGGTLSNIKWRLFMTRYSLIILFVIVEITGAESGLMAQTAKPDTLRSDTVNVWIPTMVTALNLSQIDFDNWTQGGSNSLSWTVTANVGYNYKGEKWGLNNHLTLGYGRTKLGSRASSPRSMISCLRMFFLTKPVG